MISYNLYWIFVIAMFLSMRYNEATGHWPLMKSKDTSRHASETSGDIESPQLEKDMTTKSAKVFETDGSGSDDNRNSSR